MFSTITFLIPATAAFLFLLLFIGLRQVKNASGKLLIYIFLIYLIMFLLSGISRFHNLIGLNIILFPFPSIDLALIPCLYLYYKSLTTFDFRLKKKQLLHLIPALSMLIFSLVFWFTLSRNEQTTFLTTHSSRSFSSLKHQYAYFLIYYGRLYIYYLQFAVYYILMLIGFSQHKKSIRNEEKLRQKINLNWFILFLTSYFVYEFLGIFYFLIPLINFSHLVNDLLNFIFISFLGYFGFRQANIFSLLNPEKDISEKNKTMQFSNEENEEIVKPIISKEQIKKITNEIETLIKDEFFLDCKISIHKTAQKLNTNSYYLSHVIHNEYKKNFSAFINEYRIKKAISLFSDPSNEIYTIETIAKMAGFNSKPPFNDAFKKVTGTTPSAFRKQLIQNKSVN